MIQSARAEQIQSLKNELNSVSEAAKKIFAGHSNEQLMRRPSKGGWSPAECLAHLTVTGNKTMDEMEAATAKALRESLHSNAPYKLDFTGKLFLKILEPPVRFKTPAPPAFMPDAPANGVTALEDFLKFQDRSLKALDTASAISMVNVDVTSPASAYIKYNLYSAFRITAAHERRHIWQIENVLKG